MAPPLVGVAVNITLVPAQMVLPVFAAILTDGVTGAVITIAISFEVAVAGLEHTSDEVITQVILAPLANAAFW